MIPILCVALLIFYIFPSLELSHYNVSILSNNIVEKINNTKADNVYSGISELKSIHPKHRSNEKSPAKNRINK